MVQTSSPKKHKTVNSKKKRIKNSHKVSTKNSPKTPKRKNKKVKKIYILGKGFTLLELLAVIALIAVISVTGVGVYNGVSTRVKQKAYDAKVILIENAAIKWAKENNIDVTTSLSVNKLIVEGYLTADDVSESGKPSIINPINGEEMRCKIVDISYPKGEIKAKYNSQKENCALASQADNDSNINVYVIPEKGNSYAINSSNYAEWTNQNVSLYVESKYDAQTLSITYDYLGESVEKSKSTLTKGTKQYYSNLEENKYYNIFNISANVIINNSVTITYNLNDGTSKNRRVYIRIDKEETTARVLSSANWTTSGQELTVRLDDGKGSGPKKFYLGKSSENRQEYTTNYEKKIKIKETGKYYIWTEDNVGNLSTLPKASIDINNVDDTIPNCTISFAGTKGANNWYISKTIPQMETSLAGSSGIKYGFTKEAKVTYDNYVPNSEKGILNLDEITNTPSKGTTYYCYVTTVAGTTGQNKATVYVDTVAPIINNITLTSTNSNYNTKEVNVNLNITESTSGPWQMCIQENSNIANCHWVNYNSSSKLTLNDNYTGATTTVYSWVKDNAGNISSSKSATYTTYKSCSQTVNNGSYTCGTYGICSNVCGGGTQTAEKTQPKKDKYLAGITCQAEKIANGCSQSCGGIRYENGTTCTDKCNGGTLNRIAYSTIDGSRCPSYDKANGGSSCGGIKYVDGGTCTDKCNGGTLNRVAYSKYDNSRCPANDQSSGGSSCGGIKYVDGETCSAKCNGGTLNRVAYSKYDNSRCPANDKSSGGSSCGGIKYVDGKTCSDRCNGGTLNRLAYSTFDNSRCKKKDQSSGGSKCGGTTKSCTNWTTGACSAACGSGTKVSTRTCTYTSTFDKKNCSSEKEEKKSSCTGTNCVPKNSCNIRGTTQYSASVSWNCSGPTVHYNLTKYYQRYGTDGNGTVKKGYCGSNYVCPIAPFTEKEGWTCINDSTLKKTSC